MVLHHEGFPIRKSTDQCLFTAPRGLSQLVTSFFGSWCQGIHLMLFVTWTYCSPILRWVSQYLFTDLVACFFTTLWWQNCSFLPFFLERPISIFFYCFLNICSFALFGFQWSFAITLQFSLLCYQRRFAFSLVKWSRSDFKQNSPTKRCEASFVEWSVWMDSNHRPRAYQARALTTWATDRGGDDGIRTHDPLLAGQVLSQLSYTPMGVFSGYSDWSLTIEQQKYPYNTNTHSVWFLS